MMNLLKIILFMNNDLTIDHFVLTSPLPSAVLTFRRFPLRIDVIASLLPLPVEWT